MSYHLKMKIIDFFSKYYTSKIEIKDFNVLIDENFFFDVLGKKKKNKKKRTKRLLKRVKIMIIQLVICWIINIFQNITN